MTDNLTARTHDVDGWLGAQHRQHRLRVFMQEARVWVYATVYGLLVGTMLAGFCVALWLTLVSL